MIIGRVVSIKKLYNSFMGKSVKQRIFICIIAVVMLTFLFFIIKTNIFKANIFDMPPDTAEGAEPADRPQFHISLVDIGLLTAVTGAYVIHKIREKRKQRRL